MARSQEGLVAQRRTVREATEMNGPVQARVELRVGLNSAQLQESLNVLDP